MRGRQLSTTQHITRVGAFAQYDWRDNPGGPRRGGNYFTQFSDYGNFRRLDMEAQQFVSILNQRRVFAVRAKSTLTYKDTANSVFSFGRDYGHYGRILNVTVVAVPTLTVRYDTEIVGYCFTPQDGNSLLSSVSAATWLLNPKTYEDRIQCLKPYFFDEV